ncbi:NAD(P)/FAD-dependent oxidoreductase [Aureimonas leprariae]|uniref:FAD-binding oxidoreductase n=1 Tax=Plantimonas leprariae TaxID=2615207 RepID=A0A7V7TX11_9HYPH|nr:FAD-binding oxidoreductase [Aureimonas leprariae]KAB0680400.1 FAD-binding oxidoreductase [Aureimonas leprariae]
MGDYQSPISPGRSWYEDSVGERPAYRALDGDLAVDVVVVGGGFTGLSAATHLAQRGVSVAVLEAHRFGDGASGRNGGQMNTGQRLWPEELEDTYGFERSKALFDFAEEAKAHLLDFARTQGIDIDYRPGQLSVAHKRRLVADYRSHAETMRERYGYPHIAFMDAAETAERLGSAQYFGGTRDTGTGHIHPLKLLVGSAKAAAANGAKLFERTPVLSLANENGRVRARTVRGTVTAERALLATNAHGGGLEPEAARHIMPIRSFIGATEPLPAGSDVLAGGEAVDDSRFVVRYFRRTADDRLLFGGREAYTSAAGEIGSHIRRMIAATFPQIADLPLTHAWGGSVGITVERMPFVRTVAPGVTAIGGFSGHGVMMANFSGRLYAERVTGNRDRLQLLEDLRITPFPGGRRFANPILFLAMTWFALRDRF